MSDDSPEAADSSRQPTQGSHDAESYAEVEPDGLYVEIDSEDPFERVELHVRTDDGIGIKVAGMDAEPGEYQLQKVEDAEEIVTDGGEPEFDNPRAMATPNASPAEAATGGDAIAGEVVLSWVVEQTATDLHYRIVVAPAGSGWVVLRQKRRGINSEWNTVETHDASEKPRLVAMKGVGGDD
jgi:hypothetical protein